MGRLTMADIESIKNTLEKLRTENMNVYGRISLIDDENIYEAINAVEKLAHYEDLEEAGRLIELPCAVGDTVWAIRSDINRNTNEWEHEIRACEFKISWIDGLGKWVFLTKEEAEAKLTELKGE